MVTLSSKQRRELQRLVARPAETAAVARRAHVVLWSADGISGAEIARRLHLSVEAVSRIRRRFLEGGVAGLATRPKSGRTDHAVPAATVERVVELAMSPPPAGRSRWTTRLLGKAVGLTSGCVSDLLRRNGLKPHQTRTYKVSRTYLTARREGRRFSVGASPTRQLIAPAGSRRSGGGGNEAIEAFG